MTTKEEKERWQQVLREFEGCVVDLVTGHTSDADVASFGFNAAIPLLDKEQPLDIFVVKRDKPMGKFLRDTFEGMMESQHKSTEDN